MKHIVKFSVKDISKECAEKIIEKLLAKRPEIKETAALIEVSESKDRSCCRIEITGQKKDQVKLS
jgi:hypothetical protein